MILIHTLKKPCINKVIAKRKYNEGFGFVDSREFNQSLKGIPLITGMKSLAILKGLPKTIKIKDPFDAHLIIRYTSWSKN